MNLHAVFLVFAPPEDGEWVERVVRASANAKIEVIIALDGIRDASAWGQWSRFLLRSESDGSSLVGHRELGALLARLHAAGIDVRIADRGTGAVVSALYFSRLAS